MRASLRPSERSFFSEREREALRRIARAAMPAGPTLPGGDGRCVAEVERFLGEGPGNMATGYRALLGTLDLAARASHWRGLAGLDDEAMTRLLASWRSGNIARRTALRVLLMPLKATHYHHPSAYEAVGLRFGAPRLATVERPRVFAERMMPLAALESDETVECDVVVVGTGAGGAVAARELAERGLAVVLLEEGDYHGREALTGDTLDMQKRLYRDMGATIAVGNATIPVPVGRAVGGTTIVNSGTCYRAPDRVLHEWATREGLTALAPARLAPYYERVEEVLQVAPATAAQVGVTGNVIARGCDALGWKHAPLRRNAPACDGQGLCCFGCPTEAKRSTNVSYVPLALKAGAQLFTGARVKRVLTDGGRAVGVVARGGGRTLTVKARATVIACGALLTPLLLEKSGLGADSGQLGRNLSIHPALGAVALFDDLVDAQRAVPQGYAIEEFHEEGLLFEGAFAPIDIAAAGFSLLGRELVDMLERFRHLVCFGMMIEDTSRGRVRRGPGGKPLITYWLNDHDVARLKRGVELLSRVYFAGGAKRVWPLVHGFDVFESAADLGRFRNATVRARDFDLTAYHPLGTARMGRDPRSSVVGPDHQVHGVPGLYVMDGSVMPGSPAVNPQLTIMAMATRAAESLAGALS